LTVATVLMVYPVLLVPQALPVLPELRVQRGHRVLMAPTVWTVLMACRGPLVRRD